MSVLKQVLYKVRVFITRLGVDREKPNANVWYWVLNTHRYLSTPPHNGLLTQDFGFRLVNLKYFSGLSLEDRLQNHISTFDPSRLFQIPVPVTTVFSLSFHQRNLAQSGLINDGMLCCLISILIAINRMLLPRFFIDRKSMLDENQAPDFPSIIISDILK